jgi:hypothetical protein
MTRLALLTTLLVGCGSGSTTTRFTLSETTFPPEARADVTLYGFDTSLADAAASVIADYRLALPGGALTVDIPDSPHELIDQGNGPVPAERAEFYFDVFVDLNGDAKICLGDLRQDFDVSPFKTFATPPSSIDLAMVEIDTGDCR